MTQNHASFRLKDHGHYNTGLLYSFIFIVKNYTEENIVICYVIFPLMLFKTYMFSWRYMGTYRKLGKSLFRLS